MWDDVSAVVIGVSKGSRKTTCTARRWSKLRKARRRMKDSARSETGSSMDSEITFWGWCFAERGQWGCRHENGG